MSAFIFIREIHGLDAKLTAFWRPANTARGLLSYTESGEPKPNETAKDER